MKFCAKVALLSFIPKLRFRIQLSSAAYPLQSRPNFGPRTFVDNVSAVDPAFWRFRRRA